MKKILTTIFIVLMILTTVGVAVVPHQAEAQAVLAIKPGLKLLNWVGGEAVDRTAADIGNLIIRTSAFFLSMSGLIVNISLALTTNIKAIYEATPAIDQLWLVIRNISSIFIIFGLLYASIAKILDIGGPGLGKLIKEIVIAGLLINFSLFFTKVAIDGSNLISLQFYQAIAPGKQVQLTSKNLGEVYSNAVDGGLSNSFMSGLKIQTIYDKKNGVVSAAGSDESHIFQIFVSTVAGSILMILAALSFLAAGIAFLLRLVILLLLMGFSPIYFVGRIFPEIKKKMSDVWMGHFTSQLIFMPVYLFFMYVALRFLNGNNGEGFLGILSKAQSGVTGESSSGTGMQVVTSTVATIVQYLIAYVLITIPLIAAVKTGGVSAKWGEQAKDWVRSKVGGFAAQHTIGRGAKALGDSVASSEWARRMPNLAVLTNKTLGGVSGATFGGSKGGYDARVKTYTEDRVKFANKRMSLTERDKNEINVDVTRDVNSAIMTWDTETAAIGRKVAEAQKEYDDAVRFGGPGTPVAIKKEAELNEAKAKLAGRSSGDRSNYEQKTRRELKEKAEKGKKIAATEAYASELEQDTNVATMAASKAAAKAVRKEYSKGENAKLLDDITAAIASSVPKP